MRAKLPDSESFVTRDGVKLSYEVYGDGAETILFIPPWSIVHSRIYKAQLPYFSERFRCIAYDGRGNGKSDRPADVAAYTLDNYLADALAVMDALDAKQAILVGLSFGGLVATALAAYHPERVKAAILAGTVSTVGPAHASRFAASSFMANRDSHEGWDKFNRAYWLQNYPDFAEFFIRNICSEPHSTRQIEEGVDWAAGTDGPTMVKTVEARNVLPAFDVSEAMYRNIDCPVLFLHGDNDQIQPYERARAAHAETTGAEFATFAGGGHNPLGRYPAKSNALINHFLDRRLGIAAPGRETRRREPREKRALYLSSPIGLGHGRRDIAIARELRALHPDLKVDWLAQDPVTRLLESSNEHVHPLSARLASETRHIELESGEHELHCFQALRRMDEVLIKNFMIFQDAVDQGGYDLVIADEAWDIDHYWHEHPELKKAKLAWLTDFVGYLPMISGHEELLTADYNAEMIEHVERHPAVRDRAIFVGTPDDVVPMSFGADLPMMPGWVRSHFDFSGYVIGEHPQTFGDRKSLRATLGYGNDEQVCIVTVGGSGVGAHLIRRILQAYPIVKAKLPALRMIVVAGPRIDPASLNAPDGVEVRAFVANLDRHLAACDLALVQGGLTTCMELAAAGTPFVYFPLRNHFEQNFHVAHRLRRYGAGIQMDFAAATPDMIADAMTRAISGPNAPKAVEADGARKAARMISELLTG